MFKVQILVSLAAMRNRASFVDEEFFNQQPQHIAAVTISRDHL
jgi:hypothetical protein